MFVLYNAFIMKITSQVFRSVVTFSVCLYAPVRLWLSSAREVTPKHSFLRFIFASWGLVAS